MSRFFFNIRDRGEVVEDPDGHDCASLDDARAVGVAGLRDLIASDVRAGCLDTGLAIEIVDAAGAPVGMVTFLDAVEGRDDCDGLTARSG